MSAPNVIDVRGATPGEPRFADATAAAVRLIDGGGLAAIPTETVYGLAADACNDRAVAEIFAAKGRPSFNPLIAHVDGAEMAARHVALSPLAERLAAAFWPGPLTLVLPRRLEATAGGVSALASAGLDTLAIRCPAAALTRHVIAALGRPIAAPSANRSGAVSPTTARHVADGLGDRVALILDAGPCAVGVESTIIRVDHDEATLLRAGGLPRETIEKEIGITLGARPEADAPIAAPGMLASHYAPSIALRLDADAARPGEAFLGFGPTVSGPADALPAVAFNLSPSGDLTEAAANLFAHLHALDAACRSAGIGVAAVAPIPDIGLGEAINDRLRRAAAPRP